MRTYVLIIAALCSAFAVAQSKAKPGQRTKVADLIVAIPGTNAGSSAAPEFFYAFEAGDQVMLDITMDNSEGVNELVVHTYPQGVEVHRNRMLPYMVIERLKVRERGIYRFTLSSEHATDRTASIKLWRTPESDASQEFSSTVVRKKVYSIEQVCGRQAYFVNSATKVGGNTRVILPVKLPPNTVEWFYQYTAARDKEFVDHVSGNAGLLTDLTTGLLTGGASVLARGLGSILTQPPGADYCDIYLLDESNYSPYLTEGPFNHIPDGTRVNFKSGNVRVTCCPSGQYFLGVRNKDAMHGIHVLLDVVAITAVEDWVMEGDQ